MQNASERLLGLGLEAIKDLAKDIIFGQLRLVVATMDIEKINTDRDKFLEAVSYNVESELKKIGLRLINVNVTDINDESGYISALGKEAAAKAINDARQSVAEKTRDGSIGEANAQIDERIQVEAIKNIKIDKITVWDGGSNKDGKTSTANFLSGLMKSVPPMQEMFNMAGMELPDYLGKEKTEDNLSEELAIAGNDGAEKSK